MILRRPRGPGRGPGRHRTLLALAVAALAALVVPTVAVAAPPAVTIDVPTTSGTGFCRAPYQCLQGIVTLRATATPATGRAIVSVEFQYARAGTGAWTTIGTDVAPPYSVAFNSNAVAEGLYDFRARALDSAGETGDAEPARDRLVARTFRPTAFSDPGSPLRGKISLTATTQVPDATVKVRFERAPAGSDTWTTIAVDPTVQGNPPTYSVDFDTTSAPL